MTAPFLRLNFENVLGNLTGRVVRLEAVPPQAFYEIKLSADDDVPSLAPLVFQWAVPRSLNGWKLKEAQGFITSIGFNEVIWDVVNVTQATTMTAVPVTIDEGDYTSYTSSVPSAINPVDAEVATGDMLGIYYTNNGAAFGHGALLTFGPS